MKVKRTFLVSGVCSVLLFACNNTQNKTTETQSAQDSSLSAQTNPLDTAKYNVHHAVSIASQKSADLTEQQCDSINQLGPHYRPALGYKKHPKYKVFGWHISTHGTAYKSYNFDLLWGVSYFSYLLDPSTGGYQNIYNWKATPMIDSAQKHGCQVFLTVSNFTGKSNTLFLNNKTAWDKLISELKDLLKLRKANGVNIDFENVEGKDRKNLSEFLIYFSGKMKEADPNYLISLALYAIDFEKVFEIKTIDPAIDFYTLMGYDYYGSFSKQTGPVSPLKSSKTWGFASLEYSVDFYLKEGLPAEKFIVGLPYYGADYIVTTDKAPTTITKFHSAPPYYAVHKLRLAKKLEAIQVEECGGQYITYTDENGQIKQIWYDGVKSLTEKYRYVKQKKLAGISIWALGYDHGEQNLWQLLADEFGQKSK
jgi:spore germination protein YaaH